MSEVEESEEIAARELLLQDNLAEAVRLAEVFFARQMNAQALAEQALQEKAEIEQRIQVLIVEKTAAEERVVNLDAPFFAEREVLNKRIQELENNLSEAQLLLETRLKEKNEWQARAEQARAEKAEIESLKQGFLNEKIIAQNELTALEARMASESSAMKSMIQALEISLNTAERQVETTQREKSAAEEKLDAITIEKNAVENKFENAFAGKIEAEKELNAMIKANEALNTQLEDLKKRLHLPISKAVMAGLLILALIIFAYIIYHFWCYPNRMVKVDRQIETLVTRFEDNPQLFDALNQGQKQMTARLEDIYKEVDGISKKAGLSVGADRSGAYQMETGAIGLTDRLDSLEKALSELPNGRIVSQEELSALRQKVADLELQRKQMEIEKAKLLTHEDQRFQMLTEVYFDSGETEISEKVAGNIKAAAEKIKNKRDVLIRVEGHTDDKPLRWTIFNKFSNNMELAIDRGAAVAGVLIKAGVDANQISIIGIGSLRPVAPNDCPDGRAKNRRVEIKIMDGHNT